MKKYIIGIIWFVSQSAQANLASFELFQMPANDQIGFDAMVQTHMMQRLQLAKAEQALEHEMDLIRRAFGDMPDDPNSPCAQGDKTKSKKTAPAKADEHSSTHIAQTDIVWSNLDVPSGGDALRHRPC